MLRDLTQCKSSLHYFELILPFELALNAADEKEQSLSRCRIYETNSKGVQEKTCLWKLNAEWIVLRASVNSSAPEAAFNENLIY